MYICIYVCLHMYIWSILWNLYTHFKYVTSHVSTYLFIYQPCTSKTSSLPSTSTLQPHRRLLRTMCLGTWRTTRSWWCWWGQVTRPTNVWCPWLKPCVQWPENAASLKWSWSITACVRKWRFRSSKQKLSIQRHSSNMLAIICNLVTIEGLTWSLWFIFTYDG